MTRAVRGGTASAHVGEPVEEDQPYQVDQEAEHPGEEEAGGGQLRGLVDPLQALAQNEESDEALLSEVTMLVEEISGENTVIIPPRWSSPPSFEGSSVLYVLKVGQSFYVGETDSLSQRIRQHRSKGGLWSQSSTIAVKVRGGKSNARNLESRIIQKIAQNGFSVLSTTDGRKIKPRTK